MLLNEPQACPECVDDSVAERRDFLRLVGGGTAAVIAGGVLTPAVTIASQNRPAPAPAAKPAEALCRELWGTLTAAQRQQYVYPWNHANRLRTFNSAMNGRIAQVYTPAQQELLQRIMRAISSGDDGYAKLSRNGGWDTGGGFGGCGANFFGDASTNQWSWVFSCHHLTVRCDGNSEPDYAFGGPMYYGHSPDGHSVRNVFNFQTRAVQSVYDALNEQQRTRAIMNMSAGGSNQFRRDGFPGIRSADMTPDQRRLVERVMRELLTPYRREDADEVMDIIRRNGGMDRLHFGFYRDRNADATTRWSYWRIEGPGFVWNYRVLPHVHCWVNIAVRA